MPSHRYIHKFTSGHQSFDCAASDSVASSTNEWQFVVTAAATQWSDIWLLLVRFVSGMNITNGRMKSAKGKKKKKFWFLVGVCPLRHHYTTKRTSRSPHEKHEEYTIHKTHSAFVLSIIIAGNEREISCIFVFLSLFLALCISVSLSLFLSVIFLVIIYNSLFDWLPFYFSIHFVSNSYRSDQIWNVRFYRGVRRETNFIPFFVSFKSNKQRPMQIVAHFVWPSDHGRRMMRAIKRLAHALHDSHGDTRGISVKTNRKRRMEEEPEKKKKYFEAVQCWLLMWLLKACVIFMLAKMMKFVIFYNYSKCIDQRSTQYSCKGNDKSTARRSFQISKRPLFPLPVDRRGGACDTAIVVWRWTSSATLHTNFNWHLINSSKTFYELQIIECSRVRKDATIVLSVVHIPMSVLYSIFRCWCSAPRLFPHFGKCNNWMPYCESCSIFYDYDCLTAFVRWVFWHMTSALECHGILRNGK